MKEKKKTKHKELKAYETFTLAEDNKTNPVTNVTYPSDQNVKEAKDWVDHNEK